MSKDDGGPAFPAIALNMSLRDYAYIKFMAALLGNPGTMDGMPDMTKEWLNKLREVAMREADAMLKEREKGDE